MKKQHVTLLTMSLLIMLTTTAFSQSILFTYDSAGNRISRGLWVEKINDNGNSNSGDEQKSTITLDETITIDEVDVTISPNPNGGKFSVAITNLSNNTNVEIYLHSMLGKQIYNTEQVSQITTIDITNNPNGTYILSVVVNGTRETWKIIKQW